MDELEMLDLLLKGTPIEKIRNPASQAPPAIAASQPIKQEPIVISSTPMNKDPEFIDRSGLPSSGPLTDFYKKNYENIIALAGNDADHVKAKKIESEGNYQQSREQLRDLYQKTLTAERPQYQEPALLKEKLAQVESDSKNLAEPKRDLLSEAIISLGPALLGVAVGGSGRAAALPATKASREIWDARMKEEQANFLKSRELLQNQYKQLLEMKKSDKESFDKDQERVLKQAKEFLDLNKDMTKMDQEDLKFYMEQGNKIADNLNKYLSQGVDKVGGAEMEYFKQKEAGKRAETMAGLAQQRLNQPTEGERTAAALLSRAQSALNDYENLEAQYKGKPPSVVSRNLSNFESISRLGPISQAAISSINFLKPEEKRELNSRISFINALLRKDTGAAVTPDEYSSYSREYFPAFGDDDQTIAAKAIARKQAIEGLKIQAGRALDQVNVINRAPVKSTQVVPKKMTREEKLKYLRGQ